MMRWRSTPRRSETGRPPDRSDGWNSLRAKFQCEEHDERERQIACRGLRSRALNGRSCGRRWPNPRTAWSRRGRVRWRPFMLARLSEKPAGFGDGNELSAAIERMAQGPRLADVWDIDRKMALVFGAWIEMRQRLASYNAVAAAPWTEASKRFFETMSATGTSETPASGLARGVCQVERNLQRGTHSQPAHRRLSPGPEGAAAGRIAVAKPAGRCRGGRLSHVRSADAQGFR